MCVQCKLRIADLLLDHSQAMLCFGVIGQQLSQIAQGQQPLLILALCECFVDGGTERCSTLVDLCIAG